MQQELVSIISPCYNVAPYIGRFLDSLLAQTYKTLEIILVNDGATDNTGDIIESYIPRLEAEGYKVIYIRQQNAGQSSAINNGLKHVTGKFLTWPDPDDWLTPDSIEKRVMFFHEHPEAVFVRSNIEKIVEATGKSIGTFEDPCLPARIIENAFEKLIFCQTWFGAMACMIRMDTFDQIVKDREIYVHKQAGQNWQMMLPMAKDYPVWQMPEVLGYYWIRGDSHSRRNKTCSTKINLENALESTVLSTLNSLNAADKDIIKAIQTQYARKRFLHAYYLGNIFQRATYAAKLIPHSNSAKEKFLIITKIFIPFAFLRDLKHLVCKRKTPQETA